MHRLLVGLMVMLIILLLIVGGAYGYITYYWSKVHKLSVNNLVKATPAQPMNILMIGSNSRCALNGQQAGAFGSCSQVGGARSDVTMVLHLDPAKHTAALLSLPRDLFLPIPDTNNQNRVDASLNQGPSQLVKTVEDSLGIPINHFVELNFDTFQQVVTALGGVHMYFPVPVKDAYSQLRITTPGCHYLNGFESLALVRARHLYYYQNGQWNYDGMGDLSRIIRDHEFMRVVAQTVLQKGLGNPVTDNALLSAVTPDIQVDSGFTLSDMRQLVQAYHMINPDKIPTATLPVVIWNQSYYYRGANYGDVVFPAQPLDNQYIQQYLNPSDFTTANYVSPGSVSVEVLNGSGISGQASTVASQLAGLGYNIVGTGNATVVGSPAETVIRYSSANPSLNPQSNQSTAEQLMQYFSGIAAIAKGGTTPGSDITIVTGTNTQIITPASSATSSSQPAATAPTTSSNNASSSPTSQFPQALQNDLYTSPATQPSWDPYACPSGKGTG